MTLNFENELERYKEGKISKDEFDKMLINGDILPLLEHPETGELRRYRVTSIEGDVVDGYFLSIMTELLMEAKFPEVIRLDKIGELNENI